MAASFAVQNTAAYNQSYARRSFFEVTAITVLCDRMWYSRFARRKKAPPLGSAFKIPSACSATSVFQRFWFQLCCSARLRGGY